MSVENARPVEVKTSKWNFTRWPPPPHQWTVPRKSFSDVDKTQSFRLNSLDQFWWAIVYRYFSRIWRSSYGVDEESLKNRRLLMLFFFLLGHAFTILHWKTLRHSMFRFPKKLKVYTVFLRFVSPLKKMWVIFGKSTLTMKFTLCILWSNFWSGFTE